MPGTLFVVATPIGNLEDLSFRALRTLKEVGLIAAEDTRRTAKLLAHYDIRKPMVSVREHNESRETPKLVARLEQGQQIALVTDAGTPGIADPGRRFVAACLERGIRVSPIPGPSAVTAALSASGLPADQYVFLGFPPSSGRARQRWFEDLASQTRTCVFFEAPHRVRRTLAEAGTLLVERQIFVFREISKIYEELVVLPNNTSSQSIAEAGEFTLVVSGQDADRSIDLDVRSAFDLYSRLTVGHPLSREEAVSLIAAKLQAEPAEVAKSIKKAKILADRQNRPTP